MATVAGDVICAGELADLAPATGREMGLLLYEDLNACCLLLSLHSSLTD